MPEETATLYLLLVIAAVAVVGLGLAAASFATNESVNGMMNRGGMMGNSTGGSTTGTGPGALEWTVLVVSVAFFVLAVALILRTRGARAVPPSLAVSGPVAGAPSAGVPEPVAPVAARSEDASASPALTVSAPPIPEPTLVKLLDEDERRMYLEIRSHGGQMFQRDLVALGMFSKAKVTRVLDKLESKGLVVREAHGMTNRVRLTGAVK